MTQSSEEPATLCRQLIATATFTSPTLPATTCKSKVSDTRNQGLLKDESCREE
jgi:hypothetical protein